MGEMIHSRPLASDTDDDCIGLYSVLGLRRVLQSFEKDPENEKVMERIKEEGNRFHMTQLKREWRYRYDTSPGECPWNASGNGLNFAAPAGCRYGVLSFFFPEEEKEREVCPVRLKGIHIRSAQGEDFGVLDDEISIDQSSWQSEQFPLPEGSYTLKFDYQIARRLRKGICVRIDFYDAGNCLLGSCEDWFQKKSWPQDVRQYNLSMQCCAVLYLMTGQVRYARLAKLEMLCFLNDFCQGAEYWMVKNERPEGLDCYGAVQGGRNLCSVAFTYGLLRQADVFSEEERQIFLEMIAYLLCYLLDERDRSMLTLFEAQQNSGNWQTDMCMGVACMMSVLPEFPDRKRWFYSAVQVLRGQLHYTLNPDGSWPESIHYHFAALERFALLGLLLKNETGEDLYTGEELQKMFLYPMDVQTPGYAFFKGQIGTPPFGDHILKENEFALYGAYIQMMYSHSPQLAANMYETWRRSGRGRLALWGESVLGQLLFYPSEEWERLYLSSDSQAKTADEGCLCSTAQYRDSGIYVFRGGAWPDKVNYLAVMSSRRPIRHGHCDQGSFILYHENIPLIMDTGIEGYFDASMQWHLCSMSHACLQFPAREKAALPANLQSINLSAGNYSASYGLLDVPMTSSASRIRTDGLQQGMTVTVRQIGGNGVHTRRFDFFPDSGVCSVKDTVRNFEGLVTVTYPLAARAVLVEGTHVSCEGYYGNRFFLELNGDICDISVEKGRSARYFPTDDSTATACMQFLRIRAETGRPLQVTIHPEDISWVM
ncbi:MAG: heparinase II/III family protein [Lachnospiraceae bacterium]|nr:heparinase II/III family protein [Lachnospiraceae bacterium]